MKTFLLLSCVLNNKVGKNQIKNYINVVVMEASERRSWNNNNGLYVEYKFSFSGRREKKRENKIKVVKWWQRKVNEIWNVIGGAFIFFSPTLLCSHFNSHFNKLSFCCLSHDFHWRVWKNYRKTKRKKFFYSIKWSNKKIVDGNFQINKIL